MKSTSFLLWTKLHKCFNRHIICVKPFKVIHLFDGTTIGRPHIINADVCVSCLILSYSKCIAPCLWCTAVLYYNFVFNKTKLSSKLFYTNCIFFLIWQFVCVESLVTAVVDMYPETFRRGYRRELLILGMSVVSFFIGLIMCTEVRLSHIYINGKGNKWQPFKNVKESRKFTIKDFGVEPLYILSFIRSFWCELALYD